MHPKSVKNHQKWEPGKVLAPFWDQVHTNTKKPTFHDAFWEPVLGRKSSQSGAGAPQRHFGGYLFPHSVRMVAFLIILNDFRSSTNLKNHAFALEGYQKSKCRPSLKESRQAPILDSILNDFRTPQIPFSPQSAPQGRKMTHTI